MTNSRTRRGVALLAALWLVVAIATVALQFSIEAHQRRAFGILVSERGQQRALALGAFALTRAKLEQALRVGPQGSNANVARLRASDPWLDIDSLYSGIVYVDSVPVQVDAHDLGEKLNINQLNEQDIQTFFNFLLKDMSTATHLAQSIMDWRDADSIPRPSGAERDAYIKAEMLALPTNAPFRDVEDLRDVMYMTPDIYEQAAPYFTTRGAGLVNVNTAPVPVLRALPGMTDQTLNLILQMRSQGRRINSLNDVFLAQRRGVAGRGGANPYQGLQNALSARATTNTTQVELVFTARVGPQAQPTKLTTILSRAGTNTTIQYQQW
ncbi:MAG: general secretion pathway protein GspK [Gemmatimonadaceae bacterium]